MKNSKIMFVAAMAAGLVLSACGKGNQPVEPAKKYTYRTWTDSLGSKWDPNTWETSGDSSLLGYITEGLVDIAPNSTTDATWQWAYSGATEVKDVSQENKSQLANYHINYTEPAAGEKLEGYVYEIKLNPNAKWEEKEINGKKYGGTNITADDYLESFKILLDPARKNYRANLYWGGESAVAGGNQYYNNDKQEIVQSKVYADSTAVAADVAAEKTVYLDIKNLLVDVFGYEVSDLKEFTDADGNLLPQWLPIDDETVYNTNEGWEEGTEDDAFSGSFMYGYLDAIGYFSYLKLGYGVENWGYQKSFEECVGFQKVDNLTVRYFLATQLDFNYFMTSLTSSWLVNPTLYKDLSRTDEATKLVVSDYNTTAANTLSYGPYKMVSFEAAKQVKFTQNENWWGWEKQANGALTSKTNFKVDGEYRQQYQTTDVVIDVMTQTAAKLAFEKGELNDYTPTPTEMFDYAQSSQLYQIDETYTMSFFFDTNLTDLQKMEEEGKNQNGLVISNYNFRKAFSLAIDRADWVLNTEGYKPAYSLLNSLYYYDIYNNPNSQYRKTDAAMKAIVDLYGVEYGEGKLYPTLEAAYNSITGYNLTEARALMKQAHDELVEAGLYTEGEIKIKIAYKKGALEAPDHAQVAAMNKYLNAAIEGSGFGKITLEAVGGLSDRYGDVGTRGLYAIGYGAWGGAAFYPFRNFQVYMDPDSTSSGLHEGRCWDPTKETLTLTVNGEEVTMTYQAWSNCMTGDGQFANEDASVKLEILAALEKDFLEKYYRIPLAGSTLCFLLGYQQHYYTDNYNIMYDFGGFRLTIYDYDDEAWAAYVESQGGTLNYK